MAAGLISLPFGENHGLEAGELPLFAEIPLFIVVAVATAQFLITIANASSRRSMSRSGI